MIIHQIPTGILNPRKFSFRSPGLNNYDYQAYFVIPDGVVDGVWNVTDSYGRCSPDSFMYYNYTSFYVMEDGSMITHSVEYSYGIAFTSRNF